MFLPRLLSGAPASSFSNAYEWRKKYHSVFKNTWDVARELRETFTTKAAKPFSTWGARVVRGSFLDVGERRSTKYTKWHERNQVSGWLKVGR